ncbi:hypothetical protein BS47DRAFT_1485733 [Hydnum rufescens UP504]|uniref:HNH nuclease domain-containing protein n=1 Tax=Hydnum rufescens UP504 TaxID=1448309 RepID=A0A9P6AWX6_9AGAM|nr:hypothetical protein BS47DRAFT_1485733 [Hydnum rufescens UP504]
MNARVLGYLLMYMPSTVSGGAAKLAGEIVDCEDAAALDACVILKCAGVPMFSVMGKRMERTPAHSDPSIRGLRLIEIGQTISLSLREAPALVRDNYRCMLTGKVDVNSWKNGLVEIEDGTSVAHTQLAHIFPATLTTAHEKLLKKEWTSMDPRSMALPNVLTLEMSIHEEFDKLGIYLDPIAEVGGPFLRATHSSRCSTFDFSNRFPTIVFTSSDPLLPLPNPRYLEMHAAAAKVAHLSGAAEYIERTLRDLEEVKVLSADGSSAELLKSALQISVH